MDLQLFLYFQCGNGEITAGIGKCDGKNDCVNGKDEEDCDNSGGYKTQQKDKKIKIERTSPSPPPTTPTANEKGKECHNHKPQPFPYIKRKRKPTQIDQTYEKH